jgi:hypothetical protein
MKKSLIIAGLAILTFATAISAGPPKIFVCHVPGDDVSKAFIIEVSPSAGAAHADHGDVVGSLEKLAQYSSCAI